MDRAVRDEISAKPSLGELTAVFGRIGVLSFGGPAGQIGLMHRTLVEERRWLSEERFLHALNYCMLLPGPEAQQLATYIGWLMFGVRGGMIAGLLLCCRGWPSSSSFRRLTPSIRIRVADRPVLRLEGGGAGDRRRSSDPPQPQDVEEPVSVCRCRHRLYRAVLLRPAVSARRAHGRTCGFHRGPPGRREGEHRLRSDRPAEAAEALGGHGYIDHVDRRLAVSPLVLWIFSAPEGLAAMFTFFSKMAMVTFGGAYAVLAYVAQVAVEDYGWLKPGEMLDGLALAETTPGPLVLVLSFVGFLVGFREAAGLGPVTGGVIGALLVAWATFVPSFIWIFAGAPYIERLRGNPVLSAALSAITAAVVGVILNLAIWFGLHVLFREVEQIALWPAAGLRLSWPVWTTLDPLAFLLFVISAFLLFRMKIGMVPVLVVSAVVGLAVRLAVAI